MSYSVGIVCSIGVGPARGGRTRNEDNYLICKGTDVIYMDGDRERHDVAAGAGTLLAVCDGMGGHEDGHVASATAVRVLARLFRPGVPKEPDAALLRYLQDSHRRLHEKAREGGDVKLGTTVTVCWLLDGQAHWAQIGDSRMYLFRRDALTCLTPMHTRNHFRKRDGLPPIADGEHLVQNFLYGSRGMGNNAELRLERGQDSGSVVLQAGDRLMLCSDGLWGAVDDPSLADVLRNTPDPQAAAVACMERAVARGSTDNITVMVVRVDGAPASEDLVFEDVGDDVTVMF